ncbi:MAG: 5-(carboxyamino)imidazole ribonucleotide synthase, partial [Gemmataceae bacterium]
DDFQALYRLTQTCDVVTYEFENVPVESARWLAERLPVYPPPRALEVSQERVMEKEFFRVCGIPTPPFAAIDTEADYANAIRSLLPGVLKTRRFGYDGKGQRVIRTQEDVADAWAALGGRPLILEGFVPFERELSLVVARGQNGRIAPAPLVENLHRDGILFRTLAPAPHLSEKLTDQAITYAARLLAALDYVGVLAIEFFEVNGELIANEMAPRVHNSGHWSIDAARTSQFANHMRAVLGWPVGDAAAVGHSAMMNLVGVRPPFDTILDLPGSHMHWYGKEPRPRRKVGHVNLCAISAAERDALVDRFPGTYFE